MNKRRDIFLAIILAIVAAFVVIIADRHDARPAVGAEAADDSIHFATLDVYVDPHKNAFAAYQCEIIPSVEKGRDVSFVSLGDGESHNAFTGEDKIPYYDSHALNAKSSHLIIAALSTDADLPKEKTRVARIGVSYTGRTPPTFSAANALVASPDANKMDAAVTFDLIPTPEKN